MAKRTANSSSIDSSDTLRGAKRRRGERSVSVESVPSAEHSKTRINVTNSHNDDTHDLPPLPQIRDPAIRSAVLTHQGRLSSSQNATQLASYERYEFLGDAYIGIYATRHLFSRFPELGVRQLGPLKDRLVNNDILANFSLRYKLDQMAILPSDISRSSSRRKVLGDLFEAYIAGIVLSDSEHGETVAEDWLKTLWEPLLSKQEETEIAKNGREILTNKVGGKGVRLEYRDERSPMYLGGAKTKFFVAVYLTGWGWENQFLGRGDGLSKKEASQKAAFAALDNESLINEVVKLKERHDKQVRKDVESEAARNGRTYEEQIQINHKATTDRKAKKLEDSRAQQRETWQDQVNAGHAERLRNDAKNNAKPKDSRKKEKPTAWRDNAKSLETNKLPWMIT